MSKMKVDGDCCLRCGACVAVCPVDAIEATDGYVRSNKNCTECGICVKVCPVGAIRVGKKL